MRLQHASRLEASASARCRRKMPYAASVVVPVCAAVSSTATHSRSPILPAVQTPHGETIPAYRLNPPRGHRGDPPLCMRQDALGCHVHLPAPRAQPPPQVHLSQHMLRAGELAA